MAVILALLSPLWAGVLKWAAKYALLSGLLGVMGPAISGVATLVGGIFQAAGEIVVSLSKSPEGRVILALIGAAAAFLYLRFHYIEEGKAQALAHPKTAFAAKPCPASPDRKNRR